MIESLVDEKFDPTSDPKIGVPLFTPEEVAKKLAETERVARLTLAAIIILTSLGVVGVAVLFILDKPDGATAILTLLAPTVAGLLAYRKGAENAKSLHEMRLEVDGRLTQLLKQTDAAAFAQGQIEGASTQRTRSTDKDDSASDRPEPQEGA